MKRLIMCIIMVTLFGNVHIGVLSNDPPPKTDVVEGVSLLQIEK